MSTILNINWWGRTSCEFKISHKIQMVLCNVALIFLNVCKTTK